jgi:hypothetical protein
MIDMKWLTVIENGKKKLTTMIYNEDTHTYDVVNVEEITEEEKEDKK